VNICEYLFIMNVKCRAAMGLVSFSPTEEVSEYGVRISGWVNGSDIEVVFFCGCRSFATLCANAGVRD